MTRTPSAKRLAHLEAVDVAARKFVAAMRDYREARGMYWAAVSNHHVIVAHVLTLKEMERLLQRAGEDLEALALPKRGAR